MNPVSHLPASSRTSLDTYCLQAPSSVQRGKRKRKSIIDPDLDSVTKVNYGVVYYRGKADFYSALQNVLDQVVP